MSTANIGKGRLLRACDLCGKVDDHPRHGIAGTATGEVFPAPTATIVRSVITNTPPEDLDRVLAALLDTTSTDRHLDCCRDAGCPDGSCYLYTRGAESKRGAALHSHLMKLTAADVERLAREIVAEGAALSIVKGE